MGDRKYHPAESSEWRIARVALHAAHLQFLHPRSGESVSIDCESPGFSGSSAGIDDTRPSSPVSRALPAWRTAGSARRQAPLRTSALRYSVRRSWASRRGRCRSGARGAKRARRADGRLAARGRMAAAGGAARGTPDRGRHGWFGLVAGRGAGERFATRPTPASSCAPPGARRDRPAGSRRMARGRPPACCRTIAPACAAARMPAPSRGRMAAVHRAAGGAAG